MIYQGQRGDIRVVDVEEILSVIAGGNAYSQKTFGASSLRNVRMAKLYAV